MKKPLKALLLDLDNTLWDFDANANMALEELFHRHHLHLRTGNTSENFINEYKQINNSYWERYERGEITKDFLRTRRFTDVFIKMGIPEEEHPENLWEEYLEICPKMTILIEGAIDFLRFFSEKVSIGIITNGFEKTQNVKIKASSIDNFIDFMVTSEEAGCAKPSPEIFKMALEKSHTEADTSLYVGDTFRSDIVGACNAGVPVILFDRNHSERDLIDAGHQPVFISDSLESIKAFIMETYDFPV